MSKREITVDEVRRIMAGKKYCIIDDGGKLLFTTCTMKQSEYFPPETIFSFTLLANLFGPQSMAFFEWGERNTFKVDKESLYIQGCKLTFITGNYSKIPLEG